MALVTGAGTGLGAAMALGLAEAGAAVAVLGRREGLVVQTASRIEDSGRRALAIGADVTKAEEVAHAVEQTQETLGGVDVLVNGAGVLNADPSVDVSPEDFRFVVDVNLTGAFLCAQAVGRGMLARGVGSIVNIGTFLGERGHRPARAAYNASKYGVLGLTKALAAEWGGQRRSRELHLPGRAPHAVAGACARRPECGGMAQGKDDARAHGRARGHRGAGGFSGVRRIGLHYGREYF